MDLTKFCTYKKQPPLPNRQERISKLQDKSNHLKPEVAHVAKVSDFLRGDLAVPGPGLEEGKLCLELKKLQKLLSSYVGFEIEIGRH